MRQAYSSLIEAWELVQASVKTVEQAQEALRLANVRYGAGTATQLDVLTSQVALTEARLNQLQAYYGYNVALAAMRQAIGLADEFVQFMSGEPAARKSRRPRRREAWREAGKDIRPAALAPHFVVRGLLIMAFF